MLTCRHPCLYADNFTLFLYNLFLHVFSCSNAQKLNQEQQALHAPEFSFHCRIFLFKTSLYMLQYLELHKRGACSSSTDYTAEETA